MDVDMRSTVREIARATAEAMVDRLRELQATVDRRDADGRDPAIQAACREALATIDAWVAILPPGEQQAASKALVARLMAAPAKYQPTVQPRRRQVETFKLK